MMTVSDKDWQLHHCDGDDVSDVIRGLEKSFGLTFARDAFHSVKTFGDLCTVFEQHLTVAHRDDCTTQQAFYRVRRAIAATLQINERQVGPDSTLALLFPKRGRRQKIKTFQAHLGIKVNLLTCSRWQAVLTFLFSLSSVILFFFNWKIAIAGFMLSIAVSRIIVRFRRQFDLQTVRQLARRLTVEHYAAARTVNGTVNKAEVRPVIIQAFSERLFIDKALLIPDAAFSRA